MDLDNSLGCPSHPLLNERLEVEDGNVWAGGDHKGGVVPDGPYVDGDVLGQNHEDVGVLDDAAGAEGGRLIVQRGLLVDQPLLEGWYRRISSLGEERKNKSIKGMPLVHKGLPLVPRSGCYCPHR